MLASSGQLRRRFERQSVATGSNAHRWAATPLEWAEWEQDPVVRYELAARIAAEAKAAREEAQRTLNAAETIMKQARPDDT